MVRRLRGCAWVLAVWLSATGAFGTCNFFKPAVPELPNRAPIIGDYSTPTATLQTLARGLVDKNGSNGQEVYMGALAESTQDLRAFHAFFDLRDLNQRPTWDRNRDWNRDLESVLYSDLVRKYSHPYEMTWGPYEPGGDERSEGDGSRDSTLHRRYTVVQVIGTGSTATRSPLAVGAADLYFVKSAALNRWVIVRWQDYRAIDAGADTVTLGRRRLETQP
ncbi:MAG TPA: hypothetical protein VGK89_01050 [Candidatus Eisenbacteria bacterium]|jgi:hypothetical protein